MDEAPVSEILPGLYRAVLDAVATLEARDRRPEAAAIRAEATKVYSTAWNASAAGRLRALIVRAGRSMEAPGTGRTRRYEEVLEALGRQNDLERTSV